MLRATHRAIVVASLLVTCIPNLDFAEEPRVLRDLPYKANAETEDEKNCCQLDLYLPQDPRGCATIVWFHGGGLRGGDKRGHVAQSLGNRFATDGIAVAAVNYRLLPKAEFPDYFADAAAAVKFVRDKIAEYGGSQDRIFVAGHSTGGYLAATVALDAQYLTQQDLRLTDLAGAVSVSTRMLADENGRFTKFTFNDFNVLGHRMLNDAPPLLVISPGEYLPQRALAIAGSPEIPAGTWESRAFITALHGRLPDLRHLEIKGRNHVSIVNHLIEPDDEVVQAMQQFIERLKP